ncbi:hypothetical protein IKQ26_07680 [bacterium]|nr:hypothetical protein [bacterium]
MKRFLLILLIFNTILLPSFAETIVGKVDKNIKNNSNQVIDRTTLAPLKEVLIEVPSKHYRTRTDENGCFKLGTSINSPTIMSVKKEGYKPYSLTLERDFESEPILIEIERTNANDIVIETDIIHLGDNYFSEHSANAGDFTIVSSGNSYSKIFDLRKMEYGENIYLNIGSIIGIDTLSARNLRQTRVATTWASPPEIYFNGKKIAELKINGDSQEIMLPRSLAKEGKRNELTIKTGINQKKLNGLDYDDIEFTNLIIEVR